MLEKERSYLLRRASEERRRANQAASEPARIAHDRMAEAYETQLRATGFEPLGWNR